MVTSMILSRFKGTPPNDGQDRKIEGGPLYSDIVEILEKGDTVPWTKKCIRDIQSLSMEAEDIKQMVLIAVSEGVFLGSEWCQGGKAESWAACDAYRFWHSTWCENMHKELKNEFYIKFFVNTAGTVVLTVSLHLSS